MSPPPDTDAATATNWHAVGAILLAGIFAAIHIGKLPPALPLIRAELGFGLVAGGFVMSVFTFIGMTLAVVLGGVTEWLGRRTMLASAIAALALGGAMAAVADGLPLLLASRVVEGFGFFALGVCLPSAMSAVASDRHKPLVLGLWSVYTPLGMALAMFAAPATLDALGWRGAWWAIVALCPIVLILVLRAVARLSVAPASRVNPLKLAAEAVMVPAFLVICLTFFAYVFQWMTLMLWLPTFLNEAMGFDLSTAATATAIVVLANVFGCLLGGWLLHRGASARGLIQIGALAMGLCSVGIFLPVLPDAARLGLAVIFSLLGGLIPPSLFNLVPRVAPRAALVAAGNGLLLQGSAIGQFTGAPLVAFAVTRADGAWSAALAPMLAASILVVIACRALTHVTRVRGKRPE